MGSEERKCTGQQTRTERSGHVVEIDMTSRGGGIERDRNWERERGGRGRDKDSESEAGVTYGE